LEQLLECTSAAETTCLVNQIGGTSRMSISEAL
jgi:hypothetical protein